MALKAIAIDLVVCEMSKRDQVHFWALFSTVGVSKKQKEMGKMYRSDFLICR